MKKFFLSQRILFPAVAIVAAIVRFAIFPDWRNTALGSLHLVPGLDMMTHVEYAAMLTRGQGFLTPYRALIALYGNLEWVIVFQLLTGIALALLTAWCALRIYGKRFYALAAGLIAGLYGPAVMYELTTLQESVTVFFAFAAFAAMLLARRKRFELKYALIFGAALGLAGTGRPAGLPMIALLFGWSVFYQYRRKRNWRRTAGQILCGVAIVWVPFSVVNGIIASRPLPFYGSNISYIAAVGSQSELTDWNAPAANAAKQTPDLIRIGVNLFKKLPLVFSTNEIPDNLNYYFLAGAIKVLRHLLSPLLLYPAVLAGFAFLLWGRKLFRRDALPLLYILPLALCVAAYYPVGRYRLILYPALALMACYPFYWGGRDRTRQIIAIALLIAATQLMRNVTPPPSRRASDYTAWALALEKMQNPSESPDKYHRAAFEFAPGDSANLVRAITAPLHKRQFKDAAELLSRYPHDDSYFRYYNGMLELGSGRPAEAAKFFSQVKPDELRGMTMQGYFFHAESLRLCGKKQEAAALYAAARAAAQSDAQRRLIDEAAARNEQP